MRVCTYTKLTLKTISSESPWESPRAPNDCLHGACWAGASPLFHSTRSRSLQSLHAGGEDVAADLLGVLDIKVLLSIAEEDVLGIPVSVRVKVKVRAGVRVRMRARARARDQGQG